MDATTFAFSLFVCVPKFIVVVSARCMCGNQIKIVWRSLCRAFESVSEMETGKKKKKEKVLTFWF